MNKKKLFKFLCAINKRVKLETTLKYLIKYKKNICKRIQRNCIEIDKKKTKKVINQIFVQLSKHVIKH